MDFTKSISLKVWLALCVMAFVVTVFLASEAVSHASINTTGIRTETPGAFLHWPLSSQIGISNVLRLPDSKWTHNFLGITNCPPYPALINTGNWLDGLQYAGDFDAYALDGTTKDQVRWQNADDGGLYYNAFACYGNGTNSRGQHFETTGNTRISASSVNQVYSAAAGTVTNIEVAPNCDNNSSSREYNVFIRHSDVNGSGQTWYTIYKHIKNVDTDLEGTNVAKGATLGNVACSNLDFEVAINDDGSKESSRNPWGIDQSPWTGCLWLDSELCPIEDVSVYSNRILMLNEDRALHSSNDGDLVNIDWTQLLTGVSEYQLAGDRVAALIGSSPNTLFVTNTKIGHPWQSITSEVDSFQLHGTRLAILKGDELYVIEGDFGVLSGVPIIQNVHEYQLEGTRIGVIVGSNRQLYVKEGSLSATWQLMGTDVHSFYMDGDRLGKIEGSSRTLSVKEGELDSAWEDLGDNALHFTLDAELSRVAMVSGTNNTLFVKQGTLDNAWVELANNIQSYQIFADRVAILDQSDKLFAKEGTLTSGWVALGSNVVAYQLFGDRVGVLRSSENKFYVKDGALDSEWTLLDSGIATFQVGERPNLNAFAPRVISLNHTTGAIGSYFVLSGSGFAPNSQFSLSANGSELGVVIVDDEGNFSAEVSAENAEEGEYYLTLDTSPHMFKSLTIDEDEPVRDSVGSSFVYRIPSGYSMNNYMYLPGFVQGE